MKKTRLLTFVGILFFLPACSDKTEDKTGLIATNASLTEVGQGYSFTEGPTADQTGNVFFTDQPNDVIYKWDRTTGGITPFLKGTGRANGIAFDKEGYIIACADDHGQVWRIAPDGSHKVVINNYNEKLLNGPNDVWINPVTGGAYITDPLFPRDYWDDNDPRKQPWPATHSEQAEAGAGGHVYYLALQGNALMRVSTQPEWDANSWPNGITGTPDGKKLYVTRWTEDNEGGTWRFDINPDGTLSNLKKFVDMGGDGMSLDERGNVYISNSLGINVFDSTGNSILTIPVDGGSTNHVFGGKNGKTLFITGPEGKVNTLEMNVRGVEKF